jgi:hypothetical protein
MPGGLKKKELRTDLDLTPKQKMFVEILVQDWGSITQHEALQRAGYNCKDENSAKSTASQLFHNYYQERQVLTLQNISIKDLNKN